MMQGTIQQMREAMDDFQRKNKSCYNDISKLFKTNKKNFNQNY